MDNTGILLAAVLGSPVLVVIINRWDARQKEKRDESRAMAEKQAREQVLKVQAETASQAAQDAKKAQQAQTAAAEQVLEAAKLLVKNGAYTDEALSNIQKTVDDAKLIGETTHQIVNSRNTELLVDSATQARMIATQSLLISKLLPNDKEAKAAAEKAEIVAKAKEERAAKSVAAAAVIEESEFHPKN